MWEVNKIKKKIVVVDLVVDSAGIKKKWVVVGLKKWQWCVSRLKQRMAWGWFGW